MKLSFVMWSLVVVGAVVGLAGCATEGDEEMGTAEGAIDDQSYRTFDVSFGGTCVGKEAGQIKFRVNMPQYLNNKVTQQVPVDFVLKDPSNGWKEASRERVDLHRVGRVYGPGDRHVAVDVPKELANKNLKLEIRADFSKLPIDQLAIATSIVNEVNISEQTSVCSDNNSVYIQDLPTEAPCPSDTSRNCKVPDPSEEFIFEAAVRKAFTDNRLPRPNGFMNLRGTCGNLGPISARANVDGSGPGRLVMIQQLHDFVGGTGPRYRIVVLDRNFSAMGRGAAYDIPKMVNKQNGEWADNIGVAVAGVSGNSLNVRLSQSSCSK